MSTAYRMQENGPIVGYGTRHVLTLPAGAGVENVVAFYRQRMEPAWQLVERLDGPVLAYRRGEAMVSINLESWRASEIEIAADHAYYGNRDLLQGGGPPGG